VLISAIQKCLALLALVGLVACTPPPDDTVIPTMLILPSVTPTTPVEPPIASVEPATETPSDVPASPTHTPTLDETPTLPAPTATETVTARSTTAATATNTPTDVPTLELIAPVTRTAVPTLPLVASPTPSPFVLVQPPIIPRQGDEFPTTVPTFAPVTRQGPRISPPTLTLTPSYTYTATATHTLSAPPTELITLVPATPFESLPTLDRPPGSTPPPGSGG
jgi:hypothetical protein